jgi:hypothetical protein
VEAVKLPWQKSDSSTETSSSTGVGSTAATPETTDAVETPEEVKYPRGYTPPKGRPTPTRREQEIAAGVIRDPNAASSHQAAQRRKELKKSLSKAEWKEYKQKEREENRERNREYQKRMNAGDERYLPETDRGPERRYVRDWVDSRRSFNNYVMPIALGLLVVMFIGMVAPIVANVLSIAAMAVILIFFIEGIMIGRGANRAVRAKFPETSVTGFGLGMYAYSRSTQLRRWRTPKPRVELGDKV